jgi:hypothetical protein
MEDKMRGETFFDIVYCYIDVNNIRKVKTISDYRGGNVGYKVEDNVLRVWMTSDTLEKTRLIPLDRVEYIEFIQRARNSRETVK